MSNTGTASLLIKNARIVATMDADDKEIPYCDVFIKDSKISAVGTDLGVSADDTIDASGCVVLPGFVNTHNHAYQALYRSIPQTLDVGFVEWLGYLSSVWMKKPVTPEATRSASLVNFGELLLSGCTTTADQFYPYSSGIPQTYVGHSFDAAEVAGIRLHAARGCCTLGSSKGGLVADAITQTEAVVMRHAQELIEQYHDANDLAMKRMLLAPLGIYADTETIYREMRGLADSYTSVHLHTHLHEIADVDFAQQHYGLRPIEFMEKVGWMGEDVVFYHMSAPAPTSDEVSRLAQSGSFVSSCVGSDMRLGYGLAPLRELIDAGGNVCLGTTGPASNVGADLVTESKLCLLAHRLRGDEALWLTVREVLRMATKGGARALGRPDLGSIEPGKGADLAIFDVSGIDMAGHHDPVAALLLQGSSHVTKATVVNGKVVVRDGRLTTFDQEEATRDANDWARRLVEEA